jgi:acyl-CoA thioester hydrolase
MADSRSLYRSPLDRASARRTARFILRCMREEVLACRRMKRRSGTHAEERAASGKTPARIGRMSIRVRYVECDPMGLVHHAMYPVWFEMGRTELLRDAGMDYRDLEAEGIFLAVVSLDVRYKLPARYDDVLTLETTLENCGRVKIEHTYRLVRDHLLLTTGSTTLACLDRQGKLQPVPDELLRLWT